MDTRDDEPPVEANMRDLRDIAQRLPPANDMETEPPPSQKTEATAIPSPPLSQKAKNVLLRVRWAALAVVVTVIVTLGGALTGGAFVTSEIQRWALAMLLIGLGLLLIMLLDWALQWPERAVLGRVQKSESTFLTQAKAQAGRMFEPR